MWIGIWWIWWRRDDPDAEQQLPMQCVIFDYPDYRPRAGSGAKGPPVQFAAWILPGMTSISDTLDVVQNTPELSIHQFQTDTKWWLWWDSTNKGNDENRVMKMSRRKRFWLFLCLRLQLSCIEACSSKQQTPPAPAGDEIKALTFQNWVINPFQRYPPSPCWTMRPSLAHGEPQVTLKLSQLMDLTQAIYFSTWRRQERVRGERHLQHLNRRHYPCLQWKLYQLVRLLYHCPSPQHHPQHPASLCPRVVQWSGRGPDQTTDLLSSPPAIITEFKLSNWVKFSQKVLCRPFIWARSSQAWQWRCLLCYHHHIQAGLLFLLAVTRNARLAAKTGRNWQKWKNSNKLVQIKICFYQFLPASTSFYQF